MPGADISEARLIDTPEKSHGLGFNPPLPANPRKSYAMQQHQSGSFLPEYRITP